MDVLPGREVLQALACARRADFSGADPFPHVVIDVVIDGLLDGEAVRRLIDVFPAPGPAWRQFDEPNHRKYSLRDEEAMPEPIRAVIHELNSQVFVEFLETLTGIGGLLPDPHLFGAGLHQIACGGRLGVHVDFAQHPEVRADRRLNVLLYLNEDWHEEYGGYLQFWDRSLTRAVVTVAPVANRMVVFETGEFSYHGHPDDLAVPDGVFRRSLAWFYYTCPTVEHEDRYRTQWLAQLRRPVTARDKVREMLPAPVLELVRAGRRHLGSARPR